MICLKYEINDDTFAVMSFDGDKARIIEESDDYIVNEDIYSIMENSCKYYGSSFEGRVMGSKDILGSVYKAPIIVEESKSLIFFPTEALNSPSIAWICFNRIKNVEKYGKRTRIIFSNDESIIINCPYFSVKNQIFRCSMLESVSNHRKNVKRTE